MAVRAAVVQDEQSSSRHVGYNYGVLVYFLVYCKVHIIIIFKIYLIP